MHLGVCFLFACYYLQSIYLLLLAALHQKLCRPREYEKEKWNKKTNEKEQSQFIRTYRVYSILMTTAIFFLLFQCDFNETIYLSKISLIVFVSLSVYPLDITDNKHCACAPGFGPNTNI